MDDAYQDGYAAYPCSIYANPFKEGSVEFRRWIDGWVAGVVAERATLRIIAVTATVTSSAEDIHG